MRIMPCAPRFVRHCLPALLALASTLIAACSERPHRFDCYPQPMSTRALAQAGLKSDPNAWACIDKAHDAYLEQWQQIMADDAARLSDRIRVISDPFQGGDRNGWLNDLQTVQGFERSHATILNRMEALDTSLISAWTDCLGPDWSARMETLRIDRSIERWRGVAEANGPSMLDLRLIVPGLDLDNARREQLTEALRDYARRLEPMARKLAEARLRAPAQTIRLRDAALERGEKPNEGAITEQVRKGVRKAHDAIIALDLTTIELLRGALPEQSLERLRDAVVDAADRKRPRYGEEMLAPVAAELPTVDAPTRKLIRDAIVAHATADQVLREQIAEVALRDPEDPKLKELRKQRAQILKALNERVVSALPEAMRGAMKSMRGENVESLRRTLDTILDPAVASRFEQELPEPEPTAPAQRLPVRNGGDVLGQLLPSDFAAWAEIRIPTLAEGNPDRIKPMRLLVSDAQERWNAEWKSSLERLQPMQKAVEEAMRSDVTLSEMQQRVRTAVAELDAARSRLQLIEDPVLNDAAALMDLPTHDPRVERLRLERAAEFAGLGWRDLPVQTMFQLDREATIDLPTVIDELGLSEGSRAIADMALVDSAVPLIETAEMLRQACVQSLRSLVLELKKAQLRGTDERGMLVAMRKVVVASAASIDTAAQMRIELQRGLMEQVCDTLQPAEARALRRAYWQRAFPELFVERKPAQNAIERVIERLPQGGEARAAADAVLEARESAIDALLPAMIAARKKWPTDGMRVGRETFAQLEREAPILGTTLRVREEIDARALRSLASLHGDDPEAWRTVIEWGREHPGSYEGLPD